MSVIGTGRVKCNIIWKVFKVKPLLSTNFWEISPSLSFFLSLCVYICVCVFIYVASNRQVMKICKKYGRYSNLNTSTLNQVLGSKVSATLIWNLLVGLLFETFRLKDPLPRQGRFPRRGFCCSICKLLHFWKSPLV